MRDEDNSVVIVFPAGRMLNDENIAFVSSFLTAPFALQMGW
jgi:hypothetical protein